MSVKDTRFAGRCPICGDVLPGTDDCKMVWDCLKEALDQGQDECCTLCGEEPTHEQIVKIVAKGRPKATRLR